MDIALELAEHKQEHDIISACLKEERWAQQKLYESYYSKMMAVCLRYANSHEDARDILNEGFIKVFRYLDRYQVGTSLDSWIRRIMVNASIDFYRKSIRHRTEDMECAYAESAEGEDAISMCSAEEIMKAVQTLPPSYRAVFNLYAIEGYSHKEIGDLLNITESTSRSNLVKARGKLQEMLAHLNKVRR